MLSSISIRNFCCWNSLLVLLLSISFILYPGPGNCLSSTNNKPNIVIIIADDLGIGDVGCFGNNTIQTPNIDRIAREGAKLTHNLAAEALCTPSRAALLTGRYPVRSGMAASHAVRVSLYVSSSCGLPPNETTFAEVAKKHGYSTALIGKWHLGLHSRAGPDFLHHPNNQGFDYYYGLPLTNLKDYGDDGEGVIRSAVPNLIRSLVAVAIGGLLASIYVAKTGVLPKPVVVVLLLLFVFVPAVVLLFVTNAKLLNAIVMRNLDVVEQPIRFRNFTQRLVKEGVDFIDRSQSGGEKPFLLMMSWIQVHTVLHTSAEFRGHSKHGKYGDNVEEMDWSVGEILDALERRGILNNTFVYFSSDNGGHLEEVGHHGDQEGGWNGIYRGSKGQGSMDGGTRMPTVAMWRGHIAPGTVVDAPTSHMDVFATLSAVWSEPLPNDRVIDGRDIYPLLTGASSVSPHRFLIHYCGTEIQAARYVPENGNGDVYKLYYATPNWLPGSHTCGGLMCHCRMVTRHDPPLLYNIGKDPSETRQLSVVDHAHIVQLINDAVRDHRNTVSPDIPSQFKPWKLLPRPWLQPCCNFPYCDCVDPAYDNVTLAP